MSAIRAFGEGDLQIVTDMMHRILREGRGDAPASLRDYMRGFYLEAPGYERELRSLVHVNDAGRVTGFIGVHALPFTHRGRHVLGAISSSLMVDENIRDPMAGARLIRAFHKYPHDLAFTETANQTSTHMWNRLHWAILPQYSLDWLQVIRPSSFVTSLARRRVGLAGLAGPIASVVDRFYRKRLHAGEARWAATPSAGISSPMLRVNEIDADGFIALLDPLTAHFPLRPRWHEMPLRHMLDDATRKPDQGPLKLASVTTVNGALAGGFAYYPRKGSIARVMQVLARPGQEGAVIDCLTDHAAASGVAALRGRSQPALMTAMLTRRIAFLPTTNTVVHSGDPALLEAMLGGQAFLNGLAGEEWSRLIGGRFD